jgi:hypothetical protein
LLEKKDSILEKKEKNRRQESHTLRPLNAKDRHIFSYILNKEENHYHNQNTNFRDIPSQTTRRPTFCRRHPRQRRWRVPTQFSRGSSPATRIGRPGLADTNRGAGRVGTAELGTHCNGTGVSQLSVTCPVFLPRHLFCISPPPQVYFLRKQIPKFLIIPRVARPETDAAVLLPP